MAVSAYSTVPHYVQLGLERTKGEEEEEEETKQERNEGPT